MKKLFPLCILLLSGCALLQSSGEDLEDIPLQPVAQVDLDRYMGRWYMIANIPYFAERGNVAVYVDYRRLAPNLIEDLYSAQDGFDLQRFTRTAEIEILNPANNAEGHIYFFPAPAQDFSVLYLDEHYQYTMIGHPSRNFCWLFARGPDMPDDIYEKMRAVLKQNRFDVSRVLKIPQRPSQTGAPGFQ